MPSIADTQSFYLQTGAIDRVHSEATVEPARLASAAALAGTAGDGRRSGDLLHRRPPIHRALTTCTARRIPLGPAAAAVPSVCVEERTAARQTSARRIPLGPATAAVPSVCVEERRAAQQTS